MRTRYLLFCIFFVFGVSAQGQQRPNIVWITAEDMSPRLGSYGDDYARTPALDKLAEEGVRYTHAFSNASVCTPARSTLITGVFASSLGTQHLRRPLEEGYLPAEIRPFTEYLRKAGYYCSNNPKEDYNFKTPETAWDESGKNAHWRNRIPGQPFFSVFNYSITHQALTRYGEEELIRRSARLPENLRHDPKDAVIPPYYPDTRDVRVNMAALYTQGTLMDKRVQIILDQLEEDGLADETIVFFFTDHGDGLPRSKRWLFETGTRVPLIIRFPEKYRHMAPGAPNTAVSRPVSFIDFAPTLLNVLRLPIPGYMQGKPFLGDGVADKTGPVYLFSDRVAEVLDMSRGIRDGDFRYIRNYFPFKGRMQYEDYSEVSAIRIALRKLHAANKLKGAEQWLMQDHKPAEELYSVKDDPYEINNLAADPKYRKVLRRMRNQLAREMLRIRDLSFLPEAEMKRRAGGAPPYEVFQNKESYDLRRIMKVAQQVGMASGHAFADLLNDDDSAVRYWAITGITADRNVNESTLKAVAALLVDPIPSVRIAAAEALFIHRGFDENGMQVILSELRSGDFEIVLHAASTLEYVDARRGKKYLPELTSIYERHDFGNAYSGVPLKHVIETLTVE